MPIRWGWHLFFKKFAESFCFFAESFTIFVPMNLSIYKELLQYEEVQGDMITRLRTLGIYHIFEPIATAEKYVADNSLFNKVLFFILHAYSKDSSKDTLGSDWKTVKLTIAKEVGLPKIFIELNEPCVTKAIINYLEWQDYRVYRHLMILKMQYDEMLEASVSVLKDKDGGVDYPMKYKCGENADKLLERIRYYEEKLRDDNRDYKERIDEIEKKEQRKLGTTLSVDANEHIKD